ncbi:unnamed protein product [Heligmosomoides polygyrus]|uniref:Chromo domain-containing protein n=1 Tax=Heligmosomoides polygyrus TaxID=6339 RepID=A0A183FXP6_HELPZ|nr:unnamed protein product [Heligmosomoides polygyrus]
MVKCRYENVFLLSSLGDETYVVEKILNTRRRNGRREYLIKWEGWPVEDSTWEEERHCTEAIDEFNRNRSLAGKDDNAILVGDDPKQKTTSKQYRGARRATLSESMGLEMPKTKSRRRTISKSQSGSAKKQKLSPVKAKKEVSDTPVKNGVRGMSCDSDDGSVRDRFLKVKKPKSPDTESATESTSDTTEQVYKLQQGKELESIIGVNKEGAQLLYAVQYKGPEPKHQRIELVPSKVLRTHAMEVGTCFVSKYR